MRPTQEPLGLVGADALAHRDKPVLRHQLVHGLARIVCETHIAIGKDADQPARAIAARPFDHRNAGDAIALHQRQRVGEAGIGRDGDGINHHAALIFLDPANLLGLFFDRKIAMNDAQTAGLRHGDGERRFGY